MFWDLRKYDEHIDLSFSWQQCLQHRWPARLARLAVQACSSARFLVFGGIVEGLYFVREGIVAGCSFATSLTGALVMEAFD
eukprot:6424609-Pyramimonas_sp.AAC.1